MAIGSMTRVNGSRGFLPLRWVGGLGGVAVAALGVAGIVPAWPAPAGDRGDDAQRSVFEVVRPARGEMSPGRLPGCVLRPAR
jgi:hypothetical protein